MKKQLLAISCVVQVFLLMACGTPKNFQHAIYLQDSVTQAEKKVINTPIVIRPGDRLNINITAINQEAAQAFNVSSSNAANGVSGYLVDSSGNVQLLQLGSIHVDGLTQAQLQNNLQQQLVNYIKGPVVSVTIANFKVNMLGEVVRPGTLNVPDGKINILEAISQSGDLTLYGRRDNIMVIREVNGERSFGHLDISSNRVFESPYFNLQQNDVVYIEPDKTKFISNDAITSRNIRNLSLAITIITAAILVVNFLK